VQINAAMKQKNLYITALLVAATSDRKLLLETPFGTCNCNPSLDKHACIYKYVTYLLIQSEWMGSSAATPLRSNRRRKERRCFLPQNGIDLGVPSSRISGGIE
jgi:hypothetical protein